MRPPRPARVLLARTRREANRVTAAQLSDHFASRRPSATRLAQLAFAARHDRTRALDVAIGNVSLPMHPAMRARLAQLGAADSPFADGVIAYAPTIGRTEALQAFLHVIASSGFDTQGLYAQITEGGSQAMELLILGVCGPPGTEERPLLLIDAAYANYRAFASRLGRATVSVGRALDDDGHFALPDPEALEAAILSHHPGALLVIPYDNPTGQFYDQAALALLGRLCVEHGLWLVSDEAYRELQYTGAPPSSVWGLTDRDVPGIEGRRISLESASKVWNGCGLRIGALVTDNAELHARAVAENTASLASNTLGQYLFGALAHETHASLQAWYSAQRRYYSEQLHAFAEAMTAALPQAIVSRPNAALYTVVDLRRSVGADFEAAEFVRFCAGTGRVLIDGEPVTLLAAPMADFYQVPEGTPNPGRTQLRIAFVQPPALMAHVPHLLRELLTQYLALPAPSFGVALGTR
jgi:aspartate aminotransferase